MFSVRLSVERAAPVQRVSRLGRLVVQTLCVLSTLALILTLDALFLHRTLWHAVVEGEPAAVHSIKDRAEKMLHR